MLQPYGIAEALYEVPFYWMCEDRQYTPKALRHRGDFTEQLAAERIKHVFGADRVFTNVEIEMSKGKTFGCFLRSMFSYYSGIALLCYKQNQKD